MRRHDLRRILIAGLALALQAAVTHAAAPTDVESIIVKYRDESGGAAKAQSVGAELSRKIGVGLRYQRQMARGAHVMALDARLPVADAEKIARQIALDPRVLYAEPDYRM